MCSNVGTTKTSAFFDFLHLMVLARGDPFFIFALWLGFLHSVWFWSVTVVVPFAFVKSLSSSHFSDKNHVWSWSLSSRFSLLAALFGLSHPSVGADALIIFDWGRPFFLRCRYHFVSAKVASLSIRLFFLRVDCGFSVNGMHITPYLV